MATPRAGAPKRAEKPVKGEKKSASAATRKMNAPKRTSVSDLQPFRSRDSLGALRPNQAELDAAHARGFMLGLETGRADALDDLRTVLFELLDELLGEPTEAQMERIESADRKTLIRWILATPLKESVSEVFG